MKKKYNTVMAVISLLLMLVLVFYNFRIYNNVNEFKEKYNAVSYEKTYIQPRSLGSLSRDEMNHPTTIRFLFLDSNGEAIPMDNDTRLEYYELNKEVDNYIDSLKMIGTIFFIAAILGVIFSAKDRYNITGLLMLMIFGMFVSFYNSYLGIYIVPLFIFTIVAAFLTYKSKFVDYNGNLFLTFK